MFLASAIPLSTRNIKLTACIVIYSIANLNICSTVFLSQTFESCGIFLQDFHPLTSEQRDVFHEVLEHLHLNQTKPTSLIIKTNLSLTKIQPNIFRSMTYDCFLHVQ